jgi:hypothetical protein
MSNENLTLFVNKTSDKLINELRRPSCLLHSLVQLKTPTLLGEVEGLLHLGVRGHRAPFRHHLHDTWLVRFSLHIEHLEFTEGHWTHAYVSIGHIHQNGVSYLSLIKTQ